ncbi:hypothetical protein Tco_1578233 [Tanacetum coccineum]
MVTKRQNAMRAESCGFKQQALMDVDDSSRLVSMERAVSHRERPSDEGQEDQQNEVLWSARRLVEPTAGGLNGNSESRAVAKD